MANFRKSFNFRNGVQVDSSNFIVNPNGLVGIGTSIPSEALDLKGNAKVSGLTTTNTFAVGSGATFYGNIDIGDVSINSLSGIVSATSFRGDGSLLDGVVAIATAGFIVNLSGLHTFESVGIGTSNQSYYLQIEGDPTTTTGVGITNGIVRASGGFVGDITGDVTGTATTATNLSNAANITSGTISNDRLPASISSNITGTATTATNLANASNITTGTIDAARLPTTLTATIIGTATTATNLADAANITTGTISNDRLPTSITATITGTATTATNLEDAANIITGTISDARLPATITSNITGNAGTATTLTDAANITTGTISDARLPNLISSNINVTSGVSTFVEVVSSQFSGDLVGGVTGNVTGTATTATNLADAANITTGTISDARLPDTITSNIDINTGVSIFNQIGINTSVPNSDLHIVGDASQIIQVTSNSNSSKIAIGKTVSLLGYNGFIEYGNSNNGHGKSFALDFVNYGPDGINYYLQGSAPTTSNFTWHRGLIAEELMTLTPSGNLGIGITNPEHKLNVQGISTFSGSAHFNQNVTIDGSLNFNPSATITVSQVTSNLRGDVLSSGSNVILDSGTNGTDALLTGNIFVPQTAGISTFREISIEASSPRPPLRVSTASTTVGDDIVVDVNPEDYNKFVINDLGGVGIGTTTPVGTLDLRYAGRTGLGTPSASFVNFPEVTTPQRSSITAVVGSVIYNSTSNRLEILLPGGWAGISTEA